MPTPETRPANKLHALHLQAAQSVHRLCKWYSCDISRAAPIPAKGHRQLCLHTTTAFGLTSVGGVFHLFAPQGMTGSALLAESYLAIHTEPGKRFATVDI